MYIFYTLFIYIYVRKNLYEKLFTKYFVVVQEMRIRTKLSCDVFLVVVVVVVLDGIMLWENYIASCIVAFPCADGFFVVNY